MKIISWQNPDLGCVEPLSKERQASQSQKACSPRTGWDECGVWQPKDELPAGPQEEHIPTPKDHQQLDAGLFISTTDSPVVTACRAKAPEVITSLA